MKAGRSEPRVSVPTKATAALYAFMAHPALGTSCDVLLVARLAEHTSDDHATRRFEISLATILAMVSRRVIVTLDLVCSEGVSYTKIILFIVIPNP